MEARDWYAPLEKHFCCPRWRGESLVGKTILIVALVLTAIVLAVAWFAFGSGKAGDGAASGGAAGAAAGASTPTVTVMIPGRQSVEAVIAANPEAIVASGMNDARPEWLDDWKRWPSVVAVARDNRFFVPPELIQRHTPRLLDGAERLCQHLETARSRRPRD